MIRVAVDLGCGEGEFAESFAADLKHRKFKTFKDVISYDLVSVKPHIQACDIAKLPLADSSIDITIFCLSLMGTNYKQFIKEAFRVLKVGGLLIISEIVSRYSSVQDFVAVVSNFGAKLVHQDDMNTYFNLLVFEKTENRKLDSINHKVNWENLLKPCLYKKR
jgi:ribosomal RNA-processing protein 8